MIVFQLVRSVVSSPAPDDVGYLRQIKPRQQMPAPPACPVDPMVVAMFCSHVGTELISWDSLRADVQASSRLLA